MLKIKVTKIVITNEKEEVLKVVDYKRAEKLFKGERPLEVAYHTLQAYIDLKEPKFDVYYDLIKEIVDEEG